MTASLRLVRSHIPAMRSSQSSSAPSDCSPLASGLERLQGRNTSENKQFSTACFRRAWRRQPRLGSRLRRVEGSRGFNHFDSPPRRCADLRDSSEGRLCPGHTRPDRAEPSTSAAPAPAPWPSAPRRLTNAQSRPSKEKGQGRQKGTTRRGTARRILSTRLPSVRHTTSSPACSPPLRLHPKSRPRVRLIPAQSKISVPPAQAHFLHRWTRPPTPSPRTTTLPLPS
jgi:hypothetical protein